MALQERDKRREEDFIPSGPDEGMGPLPLPDTLAPPPKVPPPPAPATTTPTPIEPPSPPPW